MPLIKIISLWYARMLNIGSAFCIYMGIPSNTLSKVWLKHTSYLHLMNFILLRHWSVKGKVYTISLCPCIFLSVDKMMHALIWKYKKKHLRYSCLNRFFFTYLCFLIYWLPVRFCPSLEPTPHSMLSFSETLQIAYLWVSFIQILVCLNEKLLLWVSFI